MSELIDALISSGDKQGGYKIEMEGGAGVINTPGLRGSTAANYDDILRECGLDPEKHELVGAPGVSRWQSPSGEWLTSYRIRVREIRDEDQAANIGDLIAFIHDPASFPQPGVTNSPLPTVFAVGDTQLGKRDGDGTPGTVERFRQSVDAAVELYRQHPTNSVVIAFLGDLVEGYVSQGGRTAAFSDLTLTEQLRLMRHLATYAIQEFRKECGDVHIVTAPGNHGDTLRSPFVSKPSDNYDVDVIRAVEEAFDMAGITGLTFHYPQGEDLSVAVEVGGVGILCAHGHMWKKGQHWKWWQGQAFGGRPGHDAQYLLCGHLHHLHIEASSDRLFIQVPAMESRSEWYEHRTGERGNPGAVYFIAGRNGQPINLAVV